LVAELAREFNPKVLVVENVTAVRSGQHAKYWNELEARLRMESYRTISLAGDAASMGMAQQRRRVFLFAWRTERSGDFSWPVKQRARLDHVLAGVEGLPNHDPRPLLANSKIIKIAKRIGPGQKLSNVRGGPRSVHTWNIPEVFGRTTAAECKFLETIMRLRRSERRRNFGDADPVLPERLAEVFGHDSVRHIQTLLAKGYLRNVGKYIDLVHTFNGKYRRFQWDNIACTVDTRFGDPHLFLHPNEHRPFTVREAARIQGFPDTFIFSGSERDQLRLVGNAVPPTMAEAAAGIVKQLVGE
jgi:DNA (cytosine-5)-methyltransferase 1